MNPLTLCVIVAGAISICGLLAIAIQVSNPYRRLGPPGTRLLVLGNDLQRRGTCTVVRRTTGKPGSTRMCTLELRSEDFHRSIDAQCACTGDLLVVTPYGFVEPVPFWEVGPLEPTFQHRRSP